MSAVASIVEGDGEVAALPILLRRLGTWLSPTSYVEPLPPIRVRRDRFLNKEEEFRRMLQLAAAKCSEDGWVLVLLDADDDCPKALGAQILERARAVIPHRRISVVLANREYEAWFVAAARSLHGQRGFSCADKTLPEAERNRGAKEWLSQSIEDGKYREITHQPAFSACMDLQQAQAGSRSFRKLCDEWCKQVNRND